MYVFTFQSDKSCRLYESARTQQIPLLYCPNYSDLLKKCKTLPKEEYICFNNNPTSSFNQPYEVLNRTIKESGKNCLFSFIDMKPLSFLQRYVVQKKFNISGTTLYYDEIFFVKNHIFVSWLEEYVVCKNTISFSKYLFNYNIPSNDSIIIYNDIISTVNKKACIFYNINTDYSSLRTEIVLFVCTILVILVKPTVRAICLIGICFVWIGLIDYELFVNKHDRLLHEKIGYTLIDMIHHTIPMFCIYLNFLIIRDMYNKQKIDMTHLILLNNILFTIIVLFFVFEQCVITILSNYILKIDENHIYMNVLTRFKNLFEGTYLYRKSEDVFQTWKSSIKPLLIYIIYMNIVVAINYI